MLDFTGFFPTDATRKRLPGLREIRTNGIMRTALTSAYPSRGKLWARTERACTRAAGKTITTSLFMTMHRPSLACSPQTRPGHVA
jgi:hypothetical protein